MRESTPQEYLKLISTQPLLKREFFDLTWCLRQLWSPISTLQWLSPKHQYDSQPLYLELIKHYQVWGQQLV